MEVDQGCFGTHRTVLSADGRIVVFLTLSAQSYVSIQSALAMSRNQEHGVIFEFISIGSIMPKVIGSPETVADELERWVDETDCDGFNLVPVNQSIGFMEFVDLVVPELQRRGRVRTAYEAKTLREHYFGTGHTRLPSNHVAYQALPEWKKRA